MPLQSSKSGLLRTEETDLWNAFRAGDRVAFGQIYDLHIQELLSYGYRMTSDRQLIKDSIQDLFLYLWVHRENLSPTQSIKFYLYRSLRNRLIRTAEKTTEVSLDNLPFPESILTDLPYEAEWVSREQNQERSYQLQQALAKLPKRQQEVIQLRYYHDFSLEEIAKLLQINNQSVRNHLSLAVNRLRDFFEPGVLFLLLFLELLKKI
ncbi:RNA polymerase sigma factor [Arundinibacter roseus]|uniref:RNA polymerase sigma factor n=1 Tax=Arundinibacter roseus TaxID=2070510 RepID=UPI001404F97F|nr:sigma-70 family RNA polymerase sigma factor [Arundinibacter roseus]